MRSARDCDGHRLCPSIKPRTVAVGSFQFCRGEVLLFVFQDTLRRHGSFQPFRHAASSGGAFYRDFPSGLSPQSGMSFPFFSDITHDNVCITLRSSYAPGWWAAAGQIDQPAATISSPRKEFPRPVLTKISGGSTAGIVLGIPWVSRYSLVL
jgi:hypothetical protein